jgi:hypothetical protein
MAPDRAKMGERPDPGAQPLVGAAGEVLPVPRSSITWLIGQAPQNGPLSDQSRGAVAPSSGCCSLDLRTMQVWQ